MLRNATTSGAAREHTSISLAFLALTRAARRRARKRTAVHAMVRILLKHLKTQYYVRGLFALFSLISISRIQGHEMTFTIVYRFQNMVS